MKRMVLIPEERLLRYEESDKRRSELVRSGEKDKQKTEPDGIMYGGGEKEDSLSVEMIVRGIPKTMKTRAHALLERLKQREDVISWNDMGQVLLNGVLIPKSNISDLVSDAMRARKHFNPVGIQEFYRVLNDINIPKDLVRNERRWSEAEKGKTFEEVKSEEIPDWLTMNSKKKSQKGGGWFSDLAGALAKGPPRKKRRKKNLPKKPVWIF